MREQKHRASPSTLARKTVTIGCTLERKTLLKLVSKGDYHVPQRMEMSFTKANKPCQIHWVRFAGTLRQNNIFSVGIM
jgi:hypothetical protein